MLSVSLSGCAFVTPIDAGAQVRQSSADDVADCKLVATIASQTKSKVVVCRNLGKVKEELDCISEKSRCRHGANASTCVGSRSEQRHPGIPAPIAPRRRNEF